MANVSKIVMRRALVLSCVKLPLWCPTSVRKLHAGKIQNILCYYQIHIHIITHNTYIKYHKTMEASLLFSVNVLSIA